MRLDKSALKPRPQLGLALRISLRRNIGSLAERGRLAAVSNGMRYRCRSQEKKVLMHLLKANLMICPQACVST